MRCGGIAQRQLEKLRRAVGEDVLGLGHDLRVDAPADRHRAEDPPVFPDPHLRALLAGRGPVGGDERGEGGAALDPAEGVDLLEELAHGFIVAGDDRRPFRA